ncbi:alpha/beta hydrolase [Variovorax ginsengisoli]|uniref:Arylformamidase n=1 Tax=Variovorax ginsengisoli TaxID=363844 RepID=A0ABT9S1L0_9BURK|nr:alpha/beta hydrolase [Variovorax ginsengisoli]MDP9898100.1 arylformamidase [Variovorax ginsengisoli]
MTAHDSAWFEAMYNNRVRVPDSGDYMARWARDSAAVRAVAACALDVAYGNGAGETLDVFPASSPAAPVLFFIHGGYWRALDKSDHSFLAPAFTAQDVCVVVPNYALCPGTPAHPVTVADIASQMVRALVWTWRHVAAYGGDPSRITVAGHSAGGHLTAMMLGCLWPEVAPDLPTLLVRNGLSISGLYMLEPLRHVPFLGNSLGLTPDNVRPLSPALWPAPENGALHSVVGGDESDEFIRQNALIRSAWGADRVPVCDTLPGLQHFSVLDALAQPDHVLHAHAMRLLRQA